MADQAGSIKVGTIVWLRSGSPSMTITEIFSESDRKWRCAYFNKDLELKYADLSEDSLTTKKPDNIPVTWM